MMKRYGLVFYTFLFFLGVHFMEAQNPLEKFLGGGRQNWLQKLDEVFALEDSLLRHHPFEKGSGIKPYERFKYYWEPYRRTGIHPADALWDEYLRRTYLQGRPATDDSNWQLTGQTAYTVSGGMEGKGRVNAIAVDPRNANIIYVGTPAGGLWKSIDGGQTWVPLTDDLPSLGVSAIAIHPTNSNIIYIGTGDDDGGHAYSRGIFKSTDGGQTWQLQGNSANLVPGFVSEIIIHPQNPSVIWAATSSGILKSTDGGNSWRNVLGGYFRSMQIHPTNPNILYATDNTWGYNAFYRSTDGGNTWTQITSGLPASDAVDRMEIAVTPAAPDKVYLYATYQETFVGFYVSNNRGLSFTRTAESDDIADGRQSWYDLVIAVSDTDPQLILKGEIDLRRSTDGGNDFTQLNYWYVDNDQYTHADIHFIRWFNGVLYVGTDGGIYRSYDNGNHFESLNDGLAISQVYRISAAPATNGHKILGGLQDNGGMAKIGDFWNLYHGGDGMDNALDKYDPQTGYSFLYFGYTGFETHDGGATSTRMPGLPSYGAWITPLEMSPANELYAASDYLYKYNGRYWQLISNTAFSSVANVLKFDPADPTTVYVGVAGNLLKSVDGGQTFQVIFSNYSYNVTSVAINPNTGELWVTTDAEVFHSTDGQTWQNITTGIPSGLVLYDLVYHPFSDPPVLYLGTSSGVYRKVGNNSWEIFSRNLPNTHITDLEIDGRNSILFAATFGRSVWQTPVPVIRPQVDAAVTGSSLGNGIHCGDITSIDYQITNNGANALQSFSYTLNFNGQTYTGSWNGNLAPGQSTTVQVPVSRLSLTSADAEFELTVSGDQNLSNNVLYAHVIANKAETLNMSYDFESTSHELLADATDGGISTWQRAVPAGSTLTSASSGIYAYCSNPSGDYRNDNVDYLYLPCLDFSGYTNIEISFDLAFSIENGWDALYMEYSTDGNSWNILGTASDPDWYNSNQLRGACPGAQWTGSAPVFRTYRHSLDFLQGEPRVYLRFVLASDGSITDEGAVIDNLVVSGIGGIAKQTPASMTVTVYPNPVRDKALIVSSEPVECVEITGITGQIIATNAVDKQTKLHYDFSPLRPGTYILRIYAADKMVHKTIIKK